MFCPKALLSKKGVLGAVWVAAVRGVAALSREQIASTDITASVDKILPAVETTYRILGLLLLGIVRIYSKKVEYLCHECNEVLGSLESTHCTERSISTGGSTHRASKQVKKAVHPRKLVAGQEDVNKLKKSIRATRTTRVSAMISSEDVPSRAETRATFQTSTIGREAHVASDMSMFTIPKRFELDSFDLGIPEDRDEEEEDCHQLPCQDTLLEDENHPTSYLYESYKRVTCSYADLDSACIMPIRITIPTEMISAMSEVSSFLYLGCIGDEPDRNNQNSDAACFTPVKDVFPPEMVDTVAEVNDPSDRSRRVKKPQRELNRDDNGDSACYIPLPEQISENVLGNEFPSMNENCPTFEESENGLLQETNTDQSVRFPCNDSVEHESLEAPTLRCKTKLINELSPSTPEPMTEGATAEIYSPKFMVTTPAKNEKHRVNRKRRRGLYNKDYIPTDRADKRQVRRRGARALYDENIVLTNEILREAIEDASDLVYRRRKAPHTRIDTWKKIKIGSLPVTFMDPLILYSTSVSVRYTITSDVSKSPCEESVKARRRLSLDRSESNSICNDAKNIEGENISEPRKRKLDELTDSIDVPVGCCTESEQFQDDDCRFNDNIANEKGLPVGGQETAGLLERLHVSESNNPLPNEELSVMIDNIEEDIPMDEEYTRDERLLSSTRTRTVARYFHQLLVDHNCQKGDKNNYVRLGQALKGRKRKTSARFFYETLILKSHGLIEVNQEQPYEDIIVSATPWLEAELRSSGKRSYD